MLYIIVKRLFILGRRRLLLLLVLMQCFLYSYTAMADVYVVGADKVGVTDMRSTSYLVGSKFETPKAVDKYQTTANKAVNENVNAAFLKKVSTRQVHSVGAVDLVGKSDYRNIKVHYSKRNGLTYATVGATLPKTMIAGNISLTNRYVDESTEGNISIGPRKLSGGGDGFLPKPNPIGDGTLVMLMLMFGYITLRVIITYRSKKAD